METCSISYSMKAGNTSRVNIREITELAVLTAIMVGGKEAMNALPNIHPVMLMIILCVRAYGSKALYPVTGFVVIESLLYGLSIWTISYLYIWPLAALIALLFRTEESKLFWGIYAGIAGFLFGPLSALITLVLSGWRAAVAYWVAGIPYDIIHCVSNFIIVYFLLPPLYNLIVKIKSK